MSRRNRDTITEREKELDPEAMEEKRLAEAEIRQKQSNDLVADSIIRELAESEYPSHTFIRMPADAMECRGSGGSVP